MPDNHDMQIKADEIEWTEIDGGLKRKILGYNDNLMMVKILFPKGSIGYEHSHPHTQSTFVAEGVFEVTIDGKTETLKKGDTFFVQPNLKHGVKNIEEGILIDVFTPKREDFLK